MRRAVVAAGLVCPAIAYGEPKDDCSARGGTWKSALWEGCEIDGKRDGAWESRFQYGQLRQRETWVAGRKTGPAVGFHATCRIAEKGAYLDDAKDGLWIGWLSNGERKSEITYAKGAMHGRWALYDEGVKVIEGPMVDNASHGTFTEWFQTGVKWRTVEFVAGDRVGDDEAACKTAGGTWNVDYLAREDGCMVDGRRDGWWRGYYGDGKRRWRAMYVGGTKQGEHVDFHPTGQVLRRGIYDEDAPVGTHEFVSLDGKPYGASTIENGSGEWKAWFHDGTLLEHGTYAGGKQTGVWRGYYEKGNLSEETAWVDGARDGPHKQFFTTGEVMAEGAHKSDLRHGFWRAYYPNGKVAWSGSFELGQRTGYWWNGTFGGLPQAVGPMANDNRVGVWMHYHPNGELAAMGPFVDDMKQGRWLEWWPTGTFWRGVDYVEDFEDSDDARKCDGAWVSDPAQRKLGCQVCRAPVEDDEGPIERVPIGVWTWWHPNGAVEKQGALVIGKRDGPWRYWYDNGKPMLEGAFAADREQGRWLGHYRDGQQRFDGVYENGAEDGTWTSYHPDGSKALEGRYDAGKKVGPWIYFHPGGAKKDEGSYDAGLPTGAWTSYYPDGRKSSSGAYVAGKRDGEWTFWRPNGDVWRTTRYAAGKELAP